MITPPEAGRTLVHDVIYGELCLGQVLPASRQAYVKIIDELVAQGAEGVILGCTEITMLIKPDHSRVPLFDTTALHAAAAVSRAIG